MRVETPANQLEESLVVAGPLDSLDAAPNHEQLSALAASSGGTYLSESGNLLEEIEGIARKGETRFIEEKHSSIWASPYVMILVLALLVIEWYYRRRWGLV